MIKLYYNQHQQDVLLQQSPLGLKKNQYFIVQGALIPLFNCQHKNHSSLFSSFCLKLKSTTFTSSLPLLFLFFLSPANNIWWREDSGAPGQKASLNRIIHCKQRNRQHYKKETDGYFYSLFFSLRRKTFLKQKNPSQNIFFLNC